MHWSLSPRRAGRAGPPLAPPARLSVPRVVTVHLPRHYAAANARQAQTRELCCRLLRERRRALRRGDLAEVAVLDAELATLIPQLWLVRWRYGIPRAARGPAGSPAGPR